MNAWLFLCLYFVKYKAFRKIEPRQFLGGKKMDKKEIKARKKAFKKAKRKAIRPWRFLTWLSLPFAII